MNTPKPTREELLKKIQESKKKKQQRLAEIENRLNEINPSRVKDDAPFTLNIL